MDAYLESLVWKETEQEQEEKTEEAIIEQTESEVESEEIETQSEEAAEVESVGDTEKESEPVNERNGESAKLTIFAESQLEKLPVELKVTSESKSVLEETDDISTTQSVTNIKVHNVPDEKTAFRIISGNIEIIGEVNNFKLIRYMKYGFGLVTGYTKDV